MIRTTKNYAVQKPFTSQAVIANVNFVMNYVRTSTRDFAHKSINHPEMIYNDREIHVYVNVKDCNGNKCKVYSRLFEINLTGISNFYRKFIEQFCCKAAEALAVCSCF